MAVVRSFVYICEASVEETTAQRIPAPNAQRVLTDLRNMDQFCSCDCAEIRPAPVEGWCMPKPSRPFNPAVFLSIAGAGRRVIIFGQGTPADACWLF